MEIKEINNMLGMLQVNKSNTQSDASANIDFGQFLAEFDKINTVNPQSENDFFEAKKTATSDFSKVSEKSFKDKTAVSEDKTTKPETSEKTNKSKNSNNDKKVNDKEQKPEQKTEQNSDEKSEITDKSASSEGKNIREDNEQVNKTLSQEDNVTIDADSNQESQDAKQQFEEISLDVLALLGNITIIDPQSGSEIQMSGKDLADKLTSLGVDSVTLSQGEDGQNLILNMAVNEGEDTSFQDILSKMSQTTESLDAVNQPAKQAEQKNVTDTQPDADFIQGSALDEQASQLSEMLDGKKLKIEVSVKQEKIADKVDAGLIKETKLSDSVLSSIMSGDEQSNPLTETKPAVTNMPQTAQTIQNQAAQAKLAGAAVAQNTAAITAADDTASLSLDNNSTTLAQVGSLGHENLSNSKIAANDAQNISFKDVYKGMSKEVIDQVKVNITKSAVKGVDKVEIQLKPEDLGHIEVKMQIGKDGKLQAHIIASRPETAEMLQKDISGLQKAFNDAGFQTDEGSLSFSFRNEGQSNGEQERNNLRNFIGQALEQETAMDTAVNDMLYSGNLNGTNGLNIRV